MTLMQRKGRDYHMLFDDTTLLDHVIYISDESTLSPSDETIEVVVISRDDYESLLAGREVDWIKEMHG